MAGKVIIVTGASRGIGLAVSQYLLSSPQSCNVVAVARSKGPLEELSRQYQGQVAVLAADLSDLSTGQKAVDLAKDTWGKVDGLVVNHGTLEPVAKVADADPEQWRKAYDLNVLSALAITRAAIPELRKTQGRIIYTSSGASSTPYQAWGAYGSTKSALNHLAATVANEEEDLITLAVRPGVVDTSMQDLLRAEHLKTMKPSEAQKFIDLKEQGKLLKPHQPGNVLARLVLRASKELSGKFVNWNEDQLADFQE